MKKMLLLISALIIAGASFGQLTGIRNIGSPGPNDYPTIAAAIADLNTWGVGPGGVTFNIAAGYTETFLSPLAGTITATGTAANPVVFQKNGSGADPLITAAIGTTTNTDGIIKISGGDYITFDGIDLTESAANTTATTQMEWGYALVKGSSTFPANGCQNVTIKNCTITLSNTNVASVGIYSGNHVANAVSAINLGTIGTTGSGDLMNNCKFYGNTISNVCYGFKLTGYNDVNQVLFDQNNEVGAVGAGNTISNLGSSNFAAYGIWVDKQINVKVAYNTISGGGTTSNLEAITPRVSNSAEIHHNTITLTSNGSGSVYGIDGYAAGYTGYTVDIHDNLIQNSTLTGAGSFTGIAGGTGNGTVMNIYSNTITGNTATTGTMMLIDGGAATTNNIYGNLVYNNTKTGAGGLTCIRAFYYGINLHDNQVYSNNIATTGVVTAAATLSGITGSANGQTSEAIYNNNIYDLNITGTSTSTSNIVYGIYTDILSTAGRSWYNNSVHNLSIGGATASGTIYGLRIEESSTSNIYKNQVYNLSAANAAAIVYGIYSGTGIQDYLYNNFVSDLKTPAAIGLNAVNGLAIVSGTSVGAYYNTVYLNASSSATTFGSSGIYKSGATTMTDLRNNVIMNLSTPGSAGGFTVGYRWSSAFNAAYYSPASNANNFYAGTPSANMLVYYDGTNSDQTIAAFQARVSPRDALSFSENSPLMNPTSAPYDLHMNTTIPTLCESGGVPVTSPSITNDIDGNTRSTTPDVGADEFAGIASGVINPTGFAPSVMSSRQISLPFLLNPSGNTVVIVWNTTGYFTTPSGAAPAINSSFAGGTMLYSGTTSPVMHTGLTGGTTYYYKAFSWNGTSYSSGVPASATTSIGSPTSFIGYAVATSQIDLSWTKNVLSNDVVIATNTTSSFGTPVNGTTYSAGNSLPTAGTVIYAGPLAAFSHTGLTANSVHYYKIWSVDAYAWYSATGATTSATTMSCGPTSSIPFAEGFETYTVPAYGCGTVIDQNADGVTWVTTATASPAAHGGTKHLTVASGSITDDDWYFIQGLNLTAGQMYNVSFWYRPQYTNASEKFEVKWGTSPTPGGMYNPALMSITTSMLNATYQQGSCYITAPATGTYYIGWHCTSDPFTNNLYLDDISVTGNSCAPLLTATATAVTSTSADIGWTGGAPNVQIDYGAVGHVAGTGTLVSTSTNPQTISALAPLTSYDVYVRQDCGLLSYSFWTGPVTFTTAYQAPTVTTGAATSLTGTGATLNGTVSTNGLSTAVYFEYGQNTTYGLTAVATPSPVTATLPTAVTSVISGLIANGITYHFRAVGFSGGVYTYGADQTFITTQVAPTLTTTAATLLSSTGATVNGTVNANNAPSTVMFEYGLTNTYGSTQAAVPATADGSLTTTISAVLTGLTPGTLYHYRSSGTNAGGTGTGADLTFTASDAATVTTSAAAPVAANTATLNGTVNANGYSTVVTFQYGTTTAYGSTATALQSPVTGSAPTAVTAAITGLLANTLYHFRVVGVNTGGTSNGTDLTFTTVALVPIVNTTTSSITATGATLNGTVNANNIPTTASFDYGTTIAYGSNAPYASNPVTGTTLKSVSAALTGLLPATLYHWRATGTSTAGTTTGADATFTTPSLPVATTVAVTTFGSTTATLKGIVNAGGGTTTVKFEYGLTASYGTVVNGSPATASGTSNTNVTAALTGLVPNTTYHYHVFASNAGGLANGADMTFSTTLIVPTVVTTAAFAVTPSAATLNGTVNPNNTTATVSFEYGLTTAYGSSATATPSTVSGITVTGVSAALTGLLPNTLYHYRVNGTNGAGIANGTDLTFTTLSMLPAVITTAATMVTPVGATLNGTVNAYNASTAVTFEYGLTPGYGSSATATPSPVTGSVSTPVSAIITGLTPSTLYHYRIVGVNYGGTGYGEDLTFTTPVDIVFTATATQPLCFGQTGSVTLNASGGTPPYTYDPTNPATSGLGAGTYVYKLTDATGYQASASVIVNAAPSQLVLTATPTQPLCFGQTGSVSLNTSGGTPGYTYDPLNPSLTGLADGSYTYNVTDANGCTASAIVVIHVPTLLVLAATPVQPGCFGQTGSVVLNTSGGTPGYTYDPLNPPLTGLTDGSYTYNVTDANGCATSATVAIHVPTQLVLSATPTQPSCFGQTGWVVLNTSGGTPVYTYDPLNPPLTGLTNGSYTYNVTDANGCTASATVVIHVPTQLVLTATPAQPMCFGQTGTVVLVPSGGTPDYTYDPLNPPVAGLTEGSYTYNVSDANGCATSATAVIHVPTLLVLTANATQPVCFGQTGSVSLTPTGGTPPYTYDPLNPALSGLAAGTYTYYVADAHGCATGVTVTIDAAPLLVTHPQSTCSPYKVDLTASAVTSGSILYGATLSYWKDAAVTIPMLTPTSAGSGTYYIMATVSPGCSDIEPVTVTINPLPTLYTVTGGGSYCAGGSGVAIGLSGSKTGTSYSLWTGSNQVGTPVPGTGSAISFGLQTQAGSYQVFAQNPTTGCSNWMNNVVVVSITQPVIVSVSISTATITVPADQDVTFTATPVNGGSTPSYQWKVNGFNVGTNGATYTCKPVNGDAVTCILTSSVTCNSGPALSNTLIMTVNGVSANITVTGNIADGQTTCYNATQTLTVAGGSTTFVVQNGGSVTMIAGQNIIYLPGTSVQAGGYMHGYISDTYCGQKAPAIVTTPAGNEELPVISQNIYFSLYPNPTTGSFTLEQKGEKLYGKVNVDVFGMRGDKVLTSEMTGEKKHEFTLSQLPAGLYFVKVVAGEYTETIKLVVTR